MRVLMSGDVGVSYGQAYVESGLRWQELGECFGGQRNGLCGAAMPGSLFLITGLHTGDVGFTIEAHETEPSVGDEWEEVVEASFLPAGPVMLVAWAGERSWPLDLESVSYRVRYCGRGLDEDSWPDLDEEPRVVEHYLLQFWPAPPEPDRIVRESSANATYWHRFASEQPAPPSPEEQAEAERLDRIERARAAEEQRLRSEALSWGGRAPSDRLRAIDGSARSLSTLDRDLVDAVERLDGDTQRLVARWVIRRAFVEARLDEVDWVVDALAAVDRGEPLTPWFADRRDGWERVLGDERVPVTTVPSIIGPPNDMLQQAMAFPAIFSELEPDPLAAALDALWNGAAAFGHGRYGELFAEVRRAFPGLVG
ncbi:hypothetical protein [Actinokineospora enzanensis]|uniref:hypothetical protein n=1 Tax=Actinokineospora enzanensis TaxID=155975 RepID=UPI00035DF17D|nr:hypothetical protein [Actinokineospora enzanensis]